MTQGLNPLGTINSWRIITLSCLFACSTVANAQSSKDPFTQSNAPAKSNDSIANPFVVETLKPPVLQLIRQPAPDRSVSPGVEPVIVKPAEQLDWKINGVLAQRKIGITLPLLDNGLERPIATVRYRGIVSHLAENELLLTGADEGELQTISTMVDGKSIRRFTLGGKGKGDPIHAALVTVKPSTTATARLLRQLESREDTIARGLYEFSSATAMNTAATALLEIEYLQRTGSLSDSASVGLNWIMPPTTLENEILIEGVNASETGFLNAFRFPYLNSRSAQNTQVNHSWQLLKAAGVLDGNNRAIDANRVRVTVMDGGFHSGLDLAGAEINGASFDDPNPSMCSGNSECPWHGSGVAEAMAATLGNADSTAGPAGPVADVILQTSGGYDIASLFAYVDGLAATLAAGPRVLNMSFGTRVPGLLAVTTLPIDFALLALHTAGVVNVAAAGNDGLSVDQRICMDTPLGTQCHELDRSLPCEAANVLCVGALRADSTDRASFSAFGNVVIRPGNDLNTVDIFAQGVGVFVGPDPDLPGGPNALGQTVRGTSIATPLVAGIAALVVAANPEATATTVTSYLTGLASTNTTDLPVGATGDSTVIRWVNAARPVMRALRDANPDSDFAPQLTFVKPVKLGFGKPVVTINTPVTLRVNALDVEDGIDCCQISWRVDGVLLPGLGESVVTHTFTTTGNHDLEVTMTDSSGQTAVDSLTVKARL